MITWGFDSPIINGTWSQPEWVDLNKETNTFSILLNKITSVGMYKLTLQTIIQGNLLFWLILKFC